MPYASKIRGLVFSLEYVDNVREVVDALDKWVLYRLAELSTELEKLFRAQVLVSEKDDFVVE